MPPLPHASNGRRWRWVPFTDTELSELICALDARVALAEAGDMYVRVAEARAMLADIEDYCVGPAPPHDGDGATIGPMPPGGWA